VLKDVLEDADSEVRAPYGPAAALVGYSSTGSSLDWAAAALVGYSSTGSSLDWAPC